MTTTPPDRIHLTAAHGAVTADQLRQLRDQGQHVEVLETFDRYRTGTLINASWAERFTLPTATRTGNPRS
jgi:hypothetical protein